MGLEIEPSGQDVGAEIRGLNIAEPLAAADLATAAASTRQRDRFGLQALQAIVAAETVSGA